MKSRVSGLLVLATFSAVFGATEPVSPQAPQLSVPLVPGDTVVATPFGRYDAGWLHRWVMGGGHRSLWALPVRAPVLDPDTFAGGLTLERLGGGLQTRSLSFRGADGQDWRFRSIDKDASRTLDPELRETLASKVVQDQISHLFPLSATVVDRLLEAGGVLHATPTLVVLPDHPALGEYREEFRGMLGWMEVRPDEISDGVGFAGSERVVGSDRLIERLEEEPRNRLDAGAYLRARLMDAFVGDWDRHPDQWRWAGFDRDGLLVFEPVPRDRDWALSRLDGLVALFTWIPWPHYVGFDHDFPSAFRQMWSGRVLDRRLLSGLDRAAFVEVAEDLTARLTDEVIAEAVARLPNDYRSEMGTEMEAALRNRRDDLRRFALEFYGLLVGWVDLHSTDADEVATARWLDGNRLEVTVRGIDDAPTDEPLARRIFDGSDTREVRLYLHGGDDEVVVSGQAPSSMTLRVLGGGGDDVLTAASVGGGRIQVHDARGDNRVEAAGDVGIDERRWVDPVDASENTHRAGYRDWGSRSLQLPTVRFDPDLGLFVGATHERRGFGFRHYPYRSRLAATVAMASGTGQLDASIDASLPLLGRRDLRTRVRATIFGTEFHRFYGLGNGTLANDPRGKSVYEAPRKLLAFDVGLDWLLSPEATVGLAVSLQGQHPFDREGTLIEQLQPYGGGEFEQFVLGASLAIDTRDDALTPRRGVLARAGLDWVPSGLDVVETYGAAHAEVAAHWWAGDETPLEPSLAVRVGGRRVWGQTPYFASAFVGGPATLRGFRSERFAGEAALWAGADLRLFLTEFVFLLPGDLGVLGLVDTGRVFTDEDTSERWHRAWGGGVWVSFLDAFAATLSVARSREETAVYFNLGFPF